LLDHARLREIRPRAVEALEAVGLGHRRSHRPTEMSGGEMQRVAIARALVIDPRVILADEPTGNLDSATGQDVLRLMRQASDGGRTVVMVTHDAGAARAGDRTITLSDGRVA
jgi:putative ABC transport system ATP-binding protein